MLLLAVISLVPLNSIPPGLSLCCDSSGFPSFVQQAEWEQCEITTVLWTQAVQRDGWWWLRKLVLLPCQLLGVFSVSVGDLHGSKCCVCPLHASLSLFCNLDQGENCNKGQVFILLFT